MTGGIDLRASLEFSLAARFSAQSEPQRADILWMQSPFPRPTATASVVALLETGAAHHRAGNLAGAAAAYADVLRLNPGNSEALRLQGSVFIAQGYYAEAIASLEHAIRSQPKSAEAYYGLGNALQAQKRYSEAIASYRQACKLRPKFAEALCNLGGVYATQEKWTEAAATYREAVKANPRGVAVLINLCITYRALGQADRALATARQATAADPRHADAAFETARCYIELGRLPEAIAALRQTVGLNRFHHEAFFQLGLLLQRDGQHDDAARAYRSVLAVEPKHPAALLELGLSLQSLERWDEAREAYRRFQSLQPASPKGWTNIGATFQHERRFAEAETALREALALAPESREVLCNLGIALWSQKRWAEALALARQLLARHPDDLDGLNNLGVVLTSLNRPADALAALQRAVELHPANADAHCNWGNLLVATGRPHEAITAFHTAGELNPSLATARYNEGIAQLLTGDFKNGWRNYEARFAKRPVRERHRFSQPRWQGDFPLAGRTLLVHAEQGLGDTIQFARYLPLLAARGATVIFEVQRPLLSLLSHVPGATIVVGRGDTLPEFDCHCPMLSLPFGLEAEFSAIPAAASYLTAPADKKAAWATRMTSNQSRRVGVVWAGNPLHENDHNRSIPLAEFQQLFTVHDTQFFSLQKALSPDDAATLASHNRVTDLAPLLDDFTDTASAISHLDLVVTVDTSVAHLAGALGKPFAVLLPFAPDWRWQLKRNDTPWYPTATLFRQTALADWSHPLAEAKLLLAKTSSCTEA